MLSSNTEFVSVKTNSVNGGDSHIPSNTNKSNRHNSNSNNNSDMFISGSSCNDGHAERRINKTQIVNTLEEGNALVSRLRQLEQENGMLTSTLSKLCNENARISTQLAQNEKKCVALANAPLSSSSVLHSLFEPEKVGWFAGSKSAAREKLEQLLEELQNEFVEYRASHTSSNEEVQALIGELQSAHLTAQSISAIVKAQQEVISDGALAVTVRVVSEKTGAEGALLADLRRELGRREEREEELRRELRCVREELRAKTAESRQQLRGDDLMEANAAKAKLLSPSTLNEDYNKLQKEFDAAKVEIERLQTCIEEMRRAKGHETDALKMTIGELEDRLSQSVSHNLVEGVQAENSRLSQEIELTSTRVKELEKLLELERAKTVSGGDATREGSPGTLSDGTILTTLERNNECIKRLESQRNKLVEESKQLRDIILVKEEELVRASRSTQEDKQRINFLLKRCVTLTDDANRSKAEKDAITEEYDGLQLELNKLRRQGEELVELNQRVDELRQKNDALQARLSGVEEVENQLIKAKETIAFMELAQSRTINMSQYAELQAKNTKLENTLEPIKRQLEETRKKLERVSEENESLHTVMIRQQNTIKTYEEKETALEVNEHKLREKANQLSAENARLQEVNQTLEKQMTDMQDGIKEMAVKLEQERSTALLSAEMTYKEELEQLQAKLQTANATLESVRLAQHSFVPEGIHNAVVVEKERLTAEIKQKTFEIEKLKSEILIYRQTIHDLESENEKHVQQMELLRSEHQKERGAAADRLGIELKKLSDAKTELDQLRLQVQELRISEEKLIAQTKAIEETAQRNQRAFEDKCRMEEKLLATVTATNEEMERQREELNHLAAMAEEKQKQMEEEIDALCEKLQRSGEEKETLEFKLAELQDAMRRRCDRDSCSDGNTGGGVEGLSVEMSSDAATHYARAEQLQMSLTQTQRQLEEQKQCNTEAAESFRKLLEFADSEAEVLRQRLQQLENELAKQATTPLDISSSSVATRQKKKKKKPLKKTLSAVGELNDIQTTDLLPVVTADATGIEQQQKENEGEEQQGQQRSRNKQRQRNELLNQLKLECSVLRDDNAQLKEEIVVLQQELQAARDEVERSGKEAKKKVSELQEQISFLEARLRKATDDARKDARPRDLPSLKDVLPQAQLELLMESSANTTENLNALVQRLQLEVQALTKELLPTKNKLVEYMAMADRLGIKYPFSPEMEGTAVLRLKAFHFDSKTGRARASSAPRLPGSDLRGGAMPLQYLERRSSKKRRHKSSRRSDEFVDLR